MLTFPTYEGLLKRPENGRNPKEDYLPTKRRLDELKYPEFEPGLVIQLNAQRLADDRLKLDTIVPACSYTSMGSNTYTSYITALSVLHSWSYPWTAALICIEEGH